MNTYIFHNDGLPGVSLKIDAQNEERAREILDEHLRDNEDWLSLDTVQDWRVWANF